MVKGQAVGGQWSAVSGSAGLALIIGGRKRDFAVRRHEFDREDRELIAPAAEVGQSGSQFTNVCPEFQFRPEEFCTIRSKFVNPTRELEDASCELPGWAPEIVPQIIQFQELNGEFVEPDRDFKNPITELSFCRTVPVANNLLRWLGEPKDRSH